MRKDPAQVVAEICGVLAGGGTRAAEQFIAANYPFVPITARRRRFSTCEALSVFQRDGFIDRYSGNRLVFPATLRLLSLAMPREFPYQKNWKVSETHLAFWELMPTIDHIVPVSRGGPEDPCPDNWVTTCMLRNSAKGHWTLEELDWGLHPPGDLKDWDGLTGFFIDQVAARPGLLADSYLRRWHNVLVREG